MKKSLLPLFIILLANVSHAHDHGKHWRLRAHKVYPSPTAQPLADATIHVRRNRISAISKSRGWRHGKRMRHYPQCQDGVVVAGFYNSHVHFTMNEFFPAHTAPAAQLSGVLDAMLNRYGFTTVVDTGSEPANTFALRARIEQGEVRGPRILTAGGPLYPHDGLPFYLADLPPEVLEQFAQPENARAAVRHIQSNLSAGADLTKLFVATPQQDGSVKYMPLNIARAATRWTHGWGRPVAAHPTDVQGIHTALDAGVDVLMHTTLDGGQVWPADLVTRLVDQNVSVIPTLQLWTFELERAQVPLPVAEMLVGASVEQLRSFVDAGGQVLFGTDVGYMPVFDPSAEYTLMSRAGMTPEMILASLTTAPARRWDGDPRRGVVAPHYLADLVVLEGDPQEDVRNFARVRCTFRGGRLIYSAAP